MSQGQSYHAVSAGQKCFAIAAGGTCGHIFPAKSLAEELTARGHYVVFLSDERSAAYTDLPEGCEKAITDTGRMPPGLIAKVKGGVKTMHGVVQARNILKKAGVVALAGFGGYPSVPGVLAAKSLGLPVILHESNAVLGRANRLLCKSCDVLASSFENLKHAPNSRKPVRLLSGTPVRTAIAELSQIPYQQSTENAPFNLLVFAGSQGARHFSMLIPAALELLPELMRKRLCLSLQIRTEDIALVTQHIAEMGIQAEVKSFFHDMPDRLKSAHLVIGRAGSSTISELSAAGRPSILIPLPSAMDDHQTQNARAMLESGAAWLAEEKTTIPARLAKKIHDLIDSPQLLENAAKAAQMHATPDAAHTLADTLENLSKERKQTLRKLKFKAIDARQHRQQKTEQKKTGSNNTAPANTLSNNAGNGTV